MYLTTKPGIHKAISLGVLIVIAVLGYVSHRNSAIKELYDTPLLYEACKLIDDCPHEAMTLEKASVWITIVFVILSGINLLACLFIDTTTTGLNKIDSGFHTIVGIALLVAAGMMIYSAVRIEQYFNIFYDSIATEFRKETKFIEKLVTGGLGIVASIIYFSTARAVMQIRKQPVAQTIIVQQQVPGMLYAGNKSNTQPQLYGVPNAGYVYNTQQQGQVTPQGASGFYVQQQPPAVTHGAYGRTNTQQSGLTYGFNTQPQQQTQMEYGANRFNPGGNNIPRAHSTNRY